MTLDEIKKNIRQKYADSLLLSSNGRHSNAIYLCGYCVELSLKHAVAEHMNWPRYITENKMKFLKTHDLDLLVSLTGQEVAIKRMPEWSIINRWSEDKRYEDPSVSSTINSQTIIEATKTFVENLCKISL